MDYFLLGSRGRLGSQLLENFSQNNITAIGLDFYCDWSDKGNVENIKTKFKNYSQKEATIIVASGLLDPQLPEQDLLKANYLLPRNIIEGVRDFNIRVVTFGTVMEKHPGLTNSYVKSKKLFSDFVSKETNSAEKILHIRLHTLFGLGQPNKFMFLGGILHSLKNDVDFKMTDGRQLREYHHVIDVANATKQLILNNHEKTIFNLTRGEAIRLCDLALSIFKAFNKKHLLKIGVLPSPEHEVYQATKRPTGEMYNVQFRETTSAIIDYMKVMLS